MICDRSVVFSGYSGFLHHDISETVFCIRHVLWVFIYNYTDDTNNGMWSDDEKKYLTDLWYERCFGCECVYKSSSVLSRLGSCTEASV